MSQITWLGIDGTNWVHVLWHATGGRDVVRSFVARVEALVRTLDPAAVVVCFDRRSFRHDLLSAYKSGRKPKPQGLIDDLAAAESAACAVGTVAVEEGSEADDGLATLALHGSIAGVRTIIASPDKDLRQCLWSGVRLLRSFKLVNGIPTQGDWYTEMSLFDEFGLERYQWADFQALVGDRSDAIDGAKGWGEKTAAAALQRLKTLEACFANPWAVPCTDKQRGELIKFRARADLVRQLVTLRTDVAAVWDALR